MKPDIARGLAGCEDYGIFYTVTDTGLPEHPLGIYLANRLVGRFKHEAARVFLNGVDMFWPLTHAYPTLLTQDARSAITEAGEEWEPEAENMTPRELTCYVAAINDPYINPEGV